MIELALQKPMARAVGTDGPPCALRAVSEEWHQLAVSVGRRDVGTVAWRALLWRAVRWRPVANALHTTVSEDGCGGGDGVAPGNERLPKAERDVKN